MVAIYSTFLYSLYFFATYFCPRCTKWLHVGTTVVTLFTYLKTYILYTFSNCVHISVLAVNYFKQWHFKHLYEKKRILSFFFLSVSLFTPIFLGSRQPCLGIFSDISKYQNNGIHSGALFRTPSIYSIRIPSLSTTL